MQGIWEYEYSDLLLSSAADSLSNGNPALNRPVILKHANTISICMDLHMRATPQRGGLHFSHLW